MTEGLGSWVLRREDVGRAKSVRVSLPLSAMLRGDRKEHSLGDFKTLDVWKAAEDLVETVYQVTATFPGAERYGLVSQMRRAACSVCANIAEGCGRLGDRELARFVRIAAGSAAELEAFVLLARRLNFLDDDRALTLLNKSRSVQKQLYRLNDFLLRRHCLRPTTHDP